MDAGNDLSTAEGPPLEDRPSTQGEERNISTSSSVRRLIPVGSGRRPNTSPHVAPYRQSFGKGAGAGRGGGDKADVGSGSGVPEELPALMGRPLAWADRKHEGFRKAYGFDDVEKLYAMLDFKDALIQEMAEKNRQLYEQLDTERQKMGETIQQVRGLEENLALWQNRTAVVEQHAAVLERMHHRAVMERDAAVAEASQSRRVAQVELEKQQVAWDQGKQHALQLLMDVRRVPFNMRASTSQPSSPKPTAHHNTSAPSTPAAASRKPSTAPVGKAKRSSHLSEALLPDQKEKPGQRPPWRRTISDKSSSFPHYHHLL